MINSIAISEEPDGLYRVINRYTDTPHGYNCFSLRPLNICFREYAKGLSFRVRPSIGNLLKIKYNDFNLLLGRMLDTKRICLMIYKHTWVSGTLKTKYYLKKEF